ncbi:AMP-binding protein [Nonlabens ponticola]|uniref:AMP-dependent synthetase/ligase domain-containing protein n=1 Tax=Nonlabens ponticola TaxID=2496866 RepID=A0A3S9N0T3_9FLAO|nr:AMP-binding protein [Nonlabens ponticola]AZQ44923.1 hypothetical protein EJ995_12065 [Nonlabens ponticola]
MPNLLATFFDLAVKHAQKTAIIWPNPAILELTYGQLADRVISFESYFNSLGTVKNSLALPMSSISNKNLHVILASLHQGVALTSLPRQSSKWHLLSFIWNHKIRYLILDSNNFLIRVLCNSLGIQMLQGIALSKNRFFKLKVLDGDTLALISHTSGSTDVSKPIQRTHQDLINQHEAILKIFYPQDDEIDLPLFPNLLLHNLNAGVTTVVPDIPDWKLENLEPERILKQIMRHGVTRLTGNVFYFTHLLDCIEKSSDGEFDVSTVRMIGIGGSPVPNKLLDRVSIAFQYAQLYVIYGSTEAEPIAVKEYNASLDPLLGYCVGTIHPDIELEIIEDDAVKNGDGDIIGEIVVSGKHVISKSSYHTGDYGYLLNNELYLVARKDNAMTYGGYYAYQIEHYLLSKLEISQVGVIIYPNKASIHFSGFASSNRVIDCLTKIIDIQSILVEKHPFLPVDARHLSKIRYNDL